MQKLINTHYPFLYYSTSPHAKSGGARYPTYVFQQKATDIQPLYTVKNMGCSHNYY